MNNEERESKRVKWCNVNRCPSTSLDKLMMESNLAIVNYINHLEDSQQEAVEVLKSMSLIFRRDKILGKDTIGYRAAIAAEKAIKKSELSPEAYVRYIEGLKK
jgi:hypothetical protein